LDGSLCKTSCSQEEDESGHRQEPDDRRADSAWYWWTLHPFRFLSMIGNARAMPGAVIKQPVVIAEEYYPAAHRRVAFCKENPKGLLQNAMKGKVG